MENLQEQQQTIATREKPHKSKKRVVGTIFLYLIGANLIIWFFSAVVIKAIFSIEDSLVISAVTGVFSLIITWFVIKASIESIFEKSSILSKDFLKIGVFVSLMPFTTGFLFSFVLIFIGVDVDGLLSIIAILSIYAASTFIWGAFLGAATYFWLRKFSPTTIPDQPLQKTHSTLAGALIIIGVLLFTHILIISITAGGILLRQQLEAPEEGVGIPQTTDETANWETYRNEEFGFEVKYPSDTFSISSITNGISLLSSYFITDNPSGLPGNEVVHPFSINFELRDIDILNTIKTELPYYFSQTFPNSTLDSFKTTDGSVGRSSLANRDGFSYWTGVEGLNTTYIFLPKNSDETLIVKFSNFDNRVFSNFPSSADISSDEQTEIFNSVIETLKFSGDQQTANETANWEAYQNEKYGFEIRYPDDWVTDFRVCGGDRQSGQWTYLVGFAPAPGPHGDCAALIAVNTSFDSPDSAISDWANKHIRKYWSYTKELVWETQSTKKYRVTLGKDGDVIINYLFIKDNKYFLLGGFAPTNRRYPLVLSKMLSTFKFTD